MSLRIHVDDRTIAEFSRRHYIRRLAFFGSVLRDDFRPDSDVDVLVEFEPGRGPGYIGLGQIEEDLSKLLGNRRVDLVTPKALDRRIRDRVLATAEVRFSTDAAG